MKRSYYAKYPFPVLRFSMQLAKIGLYAVSNHNSRTTGLILIRICSEGPSPGAPPPLCYVKKNARSRPSQIDNIDNVSEGTRHNCYAILLFPTYLQEA
jgi:hypothetical protein